MHTHFVCLADTDGFHNGACLHGKHLWLCTSHRLALNQKRVPFLCSSREDCEAVRWHGLVKLYRYQGAVNDLRSELCTELQAAISQRDSLAEKANQAQARAEAAQSEAAALSRGLEQQQQDIKEERQVCRTCQDFVTNFACAPEARLLSLHLTILGVIVLMIVCIRF